MTRSTVLRAGRRRAAFAGVLAVLVLLVGDVRPVRAVNARSLQEDIDQDSGVRQARSALQAARGRRDALNLNLDAAAAAYENAQAHHQRLADESSEAADSVALASARVETVADEFAERVATTYKHPDGESRLAGAVLMARDPSTALHRVELLERLTERGLWQVDDARDLQRRTADLQHQQQVIEAGTAAAAAERRRLAEDLTLAVQTAHHHVDQAERGVADATDTVKRRVAERERRARERAAREAAARAAAARVAAVVHMPGAAPAQVGGKVCPIGGPNGFIDSWGFPRSGGRSHQGVDMFSAYGMAVYAVADGVATVSHNTLGGLSISLTDTAGDRYYYAHLSDVTIGSGQQVRAGDVIGANGDSGNARGTPPHLHWQYHPGGGAPVNPYPLAAALCRG